MCFINCFDSINGFVVSKAATMFLAKNRNNSTWYPAIDKKVTYQQQPNHWKVKKRYLRPLFMGDRSDISRRITSQEFSAVFFRQKKLSLAMGTWNTTKQILRTNISERCCVFPKIYYHLPSNQIEPALSFRDKHPSDRTQAAPQASDCVSTKGGRDVLTADDHTTKAKHFQQKKICPSAEWGGKKRTIIQLLHTTNNHAYARKMQTAHRQLDWSPIWTYGMCVVMDPAVVPTNNQHLTTVAWRKKSSYTARLPFARTQL